MPVSGIGVILSGGFPYESRGTVSQFNSAYYPTRTTNYTIPIGPYSGPNSVVGLSARDETSSFKIIENQLVGISRINTDRLNTGVIFDGVIKDTSDYTSQVLTATISGVGAYINNIYVGDRSEVFSWSGLSAGGTNYLWISLVEQDINTYGYLSSRQFRQFECRSTTNGSAPSGPEASLLVATYTSGIGLNPNPYGKIKIGTVGDHVRNNQNPHGDPLYIDNVQCSGINVMGYAIWNKSVASGVPSGIPFNNVIFMNRLDILPNTFLGVSGILGNIQSGNLAGTFFSGSNFRDLYVDPGVIANFYVTSGLSVSGSLFRNTITLGSGITLLSSTNGLGLIPSVMMPLISQTTLSGSPSLHYHSLNVGSGTDVFICPRYPGATYNPVVQTSFGKGSNFQFEYNQDLGAFKPTLRCKSSSPSNLYIRSFMPQGFNKLESIDITYKVDVGSNPIQLNIRDSQGTLFSPLLGNVLSSSGVMTYNVSGISPSSKFGQNLPFDLEFSFNGTSGVSQYLGNILYHFRAQ